MLDVKVLGPYDQVGLFLAVLWLFYDQLKNCR